MSYRIAGPCTVLFNSVTLGTTKEGIVVRANSQWEPILTDRTGGAGVAHVFSGKTCLLEMVLCEKDDGTGIGLKKITTLLADGLLGLSSADDASTPGFPTSPKVAIGTLASAIAVPIRINERGGSLYWEGQKAFMLEPGEIPLTSTRELLLPVQFILLPDDNGDLLSTVPNYT